MLAWIDIETTGLTLDCQLLSIACVITDNDLNEIDFVEEIIHHNVDDLKMTDYVRGMHTSNGLLNKVQSSTTTTLNAEEKVVGLLTKYGKQNEIYMAGNSIHFDRKFIEKYLPTVHLYLNYRQVDVSSLKMMCKFWSEIEEFKKQKVHTALADTRESIAEMKYIKFKLFKQK